MKFNKALIAVLSVVASMLVFSFYTYPSVYASSVFNADIVTNGTNNQVGYYNGGTTGSYFFTVSSNANANTQNINYVRSDTNSTSPTVKTIAIKGLTGGCSPYGTCTGVTGAGSCYDAGNQCMNTTDASWTFQLRGIWCGLSECFTQSLSSSTSYPNQLIRFSPVTFVVDGYMNFSRTTYTDLGYSLWGVELSTGGVGGISLFREAYNNGGGAFSIIKTGGTSIMADVATFTAGGPTTQGDISGCWHCGGNTTRDIVIATKRESVSTAVQLYIINGDSDTLISSCTGNAGGCLSNGSTHCLNSNSGALDIGKTYSNGTVQIIVSCDAKTDTFFLSPTNAKVNHAQTTYSSSGLSNYAIGLKYDTTKNTYYVYNSAQVTQLNATFSAFGVPVAFDSTDGAFISGYVAGTTKINALAVDNTAHTLALVDTTAKMRILYLSNFVPNSGGVGTVGANDVKCFYVTSTKQTICLHTDSNGNFIVEGTGEIVANTNPPDMAIGGLLCQTGFIRTCTNGHPNDSDPKTNGSGLILFLGIWLTISAIAGVALYGKVKVEYNLMLQAVILLVVCGLTVQFGYVDQLYFYGFLFIIIGFASIGGTKFFMGHFGHRQIAEG